MRLVFLALSLIAHVVASPHSSSSVCPSSPAYVRAKCAMTITFEQPCETVRNEIEARVQSEQWVDPHNKGTYTLERGSEGTIQLSRLTGNKLYTDKMTFNFHDSNGSKPCTVYACSVSQVTSVLDFSTNFCNLHNLYCNYQDDGCPFVNHELTYEEKYDDCWQRTASNCMTTTI